ncbi:MAG TPA: hypothetical protein VNQ80_08860 [Parapedobacter sp.]|uniref:hypothetical protein n=1 Tax=Parapedobacter sp. TaxID=1958893 RepID=UPI002C6D1C9C|nr:hypothetical protein [Parapedobacter sp.]HWK57434.1 hypothetical protein [Parapedobacter sp.]
MKLNYLITTLLLLAITATSCKKNDSGPGDLLKPGSMSMNVNGDRKEAGSAFVFTAYEPENDYYLVGITGFFTAEGFTDDEEAGDAFHIYMGMTGAQFNSPKGTYDVVAEESDMEGQPTVYALYQVGIGTQAGNTYGIVDADKTVGKLTITDYAIGNQNGIPGISGKGFTKLQGTFNMTLTGVKNDGSGGAGEVVITDGKFSVRNGFGF